jgi:hypothetical protein
MFVAVENNIEMLMCDGGDVFAAVEDNVNMITCYRDTCDFKSPLRAMQLRFDMLRDQTKEMQSFLMLGKSGRRIKDRFLIGEISVKKFKSIMYMLENAKDGCGLNVEQQLTVSNLKWQCRLWLDGKMTTDDYVDQVDRIVDEYKGE